MPWTLASEDNWRQTHRMAGPVWVAGGILIAFSGFPNLTWLSIPAVILLAVIPVVYFYLIWVRGRR